MIYDEDSCPKKEHIAKAQADVVLKIDLSNKRKTPPQKQLLKEGDGWRGGGDLQEDVSGKVVMWEERM